MGKGRERGGVGREKEGGRVGRERGWGGEVRILFSS